MKMVRSYAIGKLNGNLLGGKKKDPAKAGPFSYDRKICCGGVVNPVGLTDLSTLAYDGVPYTVQGVLYKLKTRFYFY